MDNKFINKQTLSYLQSKRGEHMDQKIQTIKERLDIEYNYLNHQITDNSEELTNKINHLAEVIRRDRALLDERLDTLALTLADDVRELSVRIMITGAGILAWLTILSI